MVTRETSLSQALSQMGIPASDQAILRLARLADLLENDAVDLGFLGPNEGQRVVSRHLLESAALIPYLLPDGPVVDVGSGAGLPGLVLAALGREVVLVESQARRAGFLRRASSEIDVDVDVRHGRAEDEGRGDLRDDAYSVVARALAAPAVALELCLPFVRPGGRLLLQATPELGVESSARSGERRVGDVPESELCPPLGTDQDPPAPEGSGDARYRIQATDEREGGTSRRSDVGHPEPAASAALDEVAALLGGGGIRWQRLSVPGAEGPRWVMMVDKRVPTPDRFPRRPGVPKRRPLGGDVVSVK